jgi:hypothetical protein
VAFGTVRQEVVVEEEEQERHQLRYDHPSFHTLGFLSY